MMKPVFGQRGVPAMWIDETDERELHRAHIMRRFYSWKHIPTNVMGRSSAFFVTLRAYETTLDAWNTISRGEWEYIPGFFDNQPDNIY